MEREVALNMNIRITPTWPVMVTHAIPSGKNLIAALVGALGVAGFLNSELFLEARFSHTVIFCAC